MGKGYIMSLKTSFAKYVHFGSNRVAPDPGPAKEKAAPGKAPSQSILSNLTKRLSPSRDKRADGNTAAPAKQYRMGASVRTRQENGASVRGQKNAGKNEGLPPELQARFQALRGGPVPSEKELFARFDALKASTAQKPAGAPVQGQGKTGGNEGLPPELQARYQALRGGPVPSEKELFARFDALKAPVAQKPAAASGEPAADLKTLTQQLKKAPGPIWSAPKNSAGKTGSRPAPSSPTAKPARAALLSSQAPGARNSVQNSGKKMQAQGGAQNITPPPSPTRAAPGTPSAAGKKPSLGLSFDDFNGLADIKRRPTNPPKQSARPQGGGNASASAPPIRPFSHFEEEEAKRADNANEKPSKALAEERYQAQFFSPPTSPGRSNAASRTKPAPSSGQPVRSFDEFWEDEKARADNNNEHPSEALARERYKAQFAPEPATTRRQSRPQESRPARSDSFRSNASSNASERVIMPLSHFEKMEEDEASQFHRHAERGAALDAYLRQFE